MSYQRSFSTLGCPELNLFQTLDLARDHGLDAVELRTLDGRVDLPNYFTEHHGSPVQLASKIAAHPVRIVSLDTSLKLFVNTAADREELLAFVPWAEALGVPWMRIFDGGTSVTDNIAVAQDTIQWWRELRAAHHWTVDLMVETHDCLLDAASINELQAACPIGVLWDTHHTWKKGVEDPLTTWPAIAPHVVHLHVKDSISVPSARHPFTYVLPGDGEFPMASIRGRFAAEFSGTMSLEWERHWHPYLPTLDVALTDAQQKNWW